MIPRYYQGLNDMGQSREMLHCTLAHNESNAPDIHRRDNETLGVIQQPRLLADYLLKM